MDPTPVQSFLDLAFWHGKPFGIVRAIFVTIDALLVFGIVYSMVKGWEFRPHFDIGRGVGGKRILSLRNKVFQERWQGIMKKFSLGTPDSIRVAIIEADSLADEALKQLSYQGEHFADRLEKLSSDDFKTLNKLWHSHRIRNDLVHTPGFFLAAHDAKAVLDNYEAFLKELGVL